MDIVFLLDSLRYDSIHRALDKNSEMSRFFNRITKFTNCYAQSGWTPLAIAHMLDCTWPSKSGILPLSLKSAKPVIWKKKRSLDTSKLKENILNLYDSTLMVLFDWQSKATVFNFYKANKRTTKVLTYNRYIDSNCWNVFDYKKAISDTIDFIKTSKTNSKSIVFVRLMGTHSPYYTKTATHRKSMEFNKKNDFKNMVMNHVYTDLFYELYKYTDHKYLEEYGKNYLVNLQADGFINDWNQFCKPILSFLKKKNIYDKSQIVFFADHGETLTKYAHLQGHARYCNSDVMHVPLYVKFANQQYLSKTVTKTVRNMDILYTLAKNSGLIKDNSEFADVDSRHLLKDREVKSNEFHCKDDYFFYFPETKKTEAILLSNKKKILSKIRIKNTLKYFSSKINHKSVPRQIGKLVELNLNEYYTDSDEMGELFIKGGTDAKARNETELANYERNFSKYK